MLSLFKKLDGKKRIAEEIVTIRKLMTQIDSRLTVIENLVKPKYKVKDGKLSIE